MKPTCCQCLHARSTRRRAPKAFGPSTHPAARVTFVARILGDVWFHAPVRALAKNVEKAWYYHYTYGRESGHVLHGVGLQSLFWPSTTGEGMGFKMLDRWVNFVVHGHPGDEAWKVKPRSVPLWRIEQIQAAEDVLKEMRGEWAR
ncbi:hypothetical protein EXIGLDRAFT_778340 [Exidia glandulosa HHB12029]|uniref:Uncharacterized protein n=1 Tax=Exidia glandulosa HHB12029 TaxID=1314781 RepID=A0A165CKF5_EXIGL|nr:hypothetical protein EXIGLDRAFT_778340 [Exidia glandulosa HHB12029]